MEHHARLIEQITTQLSQLTKLQLQDVAEFVEQLGNQNSTIPAPPADVSIPTKDWPHAPLHRLTGKGAYLVTAGTYHKKHIFRTPQLLDFLESRLLILAGEHGWQIEAWAVFSNHYHFVGQALEDARTLQPFLKQLHAETAREVNEWENTQGRTVWFNFWETELTFEKSYFARLDYTHQNARRHGLVAVANQYPWCSAAWFERTATPAQVKTVYSFKTDRIKVVDDYEVLDVRR